MRFDILDEYSTLVPFGLGVSEQNRGVQYPAAATKAVECGTATNCISRFKLLLKLVSVLRHIGRREEHRPIY